jgi:hypothetical protein
MMKTDQKPKGGYKPPLLNFRATNTVIERNVRKLFAFRYLGHRQFLVDEPSILVLEQFAKKAGLGDSIISLWLGDFMSTPTMHLNKRRTTAIFKSLCHLRTLDLMLEWWRSAPSFFRGLSIGLRPHTLTMFSLNRMQIDGRDLLRVLKGQSRLQDITLDQINMRCYLTDICSIAQDLMDLRSFDILFVWASERALHFSDTDRSLPKAYSEFTMELSLRQAKLRAFSRDGMRDALKKLELIDIYSDRVCCKVGMCHPMEFWTPWKRRREAPANGSTMSKAA